MTHLLKNPKVMCKAKEELSEVIGKGNSIEESHMEKLPYLQAIISEALRMQSSFLVPRKSESEVTISGFTIPKGTQIIVNLWASCRDPNLWENPDVFMPERFLERKARNFEFIPFSHWEEDLSWSEKGNEDVTFDGVTPQNLNMDDKYELTLAKAQPLRAIPLLI
ncbi:hypothetical protein IC582_022289 [Cucumis melo]